MERVAAAVPDCPVPVERVLRGFVAGRGRGRGRRGRGWIWGSGAGSP
jgi:hypothetical protein